MRIVSTVLVAAVLTGLVAQAQTTSGSISGTVLDTQSASLVGATVSITDQEKKLLLKTTADVAGRFTFPQLQPGNYTIIIEATGFRRIERKDIVLNANDKIALPPFTAEVGSVDQTVEVTAQTQELKTESAERGEAITGKQ